MGKHYSITTVIQYSQKLKHFVTWIGNSDGKYFKTDSFMVLLTFSLLWHQVNNIFTADFADM